MYSLPSASKRWQPSPRAMKMGLPPTLRNARTGEFTPPGMRSRARWKRASDLSVFIVVVTRRFALRFRGAGDDPAEAEAHRDVVEAAVQVLHQTLFEAEIGL